MADYTAWIGREVRMDDSIVAWPVRALAATLDETMDVYDGEPLPPLWHWLYFLPTHAMSELGVEGHAEKGAFLPPIDLPRRMWAGGRLEFATGDGVLRIGDRATRTSRILDVKEKQGRTGRLVFVVVRHEVTTERGFALSEEHDIVYREHSPSEGNHVAPEGPAAPAGAQWQKTILPSDVLLFRYSALTFNAHRIHYDRRYTVKEEHYPGLIVHGPLIATLLLDLLRKQLPHAKVRRFEFRAVSPLFQVEPNPEPFLVCGREAGQAIHLWAQTEQGRLAMSASAELA